MATCPTGSAAIPNRLRQVLTNLVGNALKFTDAGSVELRLGYAARDGGILHGRGPRHRHRHSRFRAKRALYQRFAQLEAGKRGGTGLGLAICKQLVELMGGEIEVDSVAGLGSTFRFWISAPPARVAGNRGQTRKADRPDRGSPVGAQDRAHPRCRGQPDQPEGAAGLSRDGRPRRTRDIERRGGRRRGAIVRLRSGSHGHPDAAARRRRGHLPRSARWTARRRVCRSSR